MGLIQWATSPLGQNVPIHIAWFLIWVAVIAGLLFLVVHAIYMRYFAKEKVFVADASAGTTAHLPARIPRHSLTARIFHWVMAASMLTLLVTAFLPKVGVQFDWVAYHWIAGIILTISILFHIVHATFFLDFWSIWPDRTDLQDAWKRTLRFFGKPAGLPRKFAKYPLEEQAVSWRSHDQRACSSRNRHLHDVPGPHLPLPAQSLSVRRHDLGLDVRASRVCRSGIYHTCHHTHLLRRPPGEVSHHSRYAHRHHEPRILFKRA